jgi:hypothetical protein
MGPRVDWLIRDQGFAFTQENDSTHLLDESA